jgi:pimeloyl-ACP methyl ester carboxylesterase
LTTAASVPPPARRQPPSRRWPRTPSEERTSDRDTPTTISSYLAQLTACRRWSKEEPHDLSRIRQPVLLANGDHDRMLPTPNTLDMARRLPNNQLVIYPDAGHGGILQFHEQFVDKALQFLTN